MRIVAGEFRGRSLEAPQGDGTRPTIDRVREALFSSLYSLRGGLEGAVVLDAFAGSGAMGLEALSRGASKAVFYERDPKAARVCEKNIRSFGLDSSRAECVKRDVMATPPVGQSPAFDLVFLDPPYAFDPTDVVAMVGELRNTGAVAQDAIVTYEHAHTTRRETSQAIQDAGHEVVATKKYGKTCVTVWRAL